MPEQEQQPILDAPLVRDGEVQREPVAPPHRAQRNPSEYLWPLGGAAGEDAVEHRQHSRPLRGDRSLARTSPGWIRSPAPISSAATLPASTISRISRPSTTRNPM